MKVRKLLLLSVASCVSLFAAEPEIPAEDFLSRVRSASGPGSWGILSGKAVHRRSNSKRITAPIRFSVLFSGKAALARVVFREKEIYNISRSCTAPYKTTVETPAGSGLADIGLRPEDLTMNFLFLPLKKELPPERVRGQLCRVLEFCPENCQERIVVFISKSYYCPLRVMWLTGGKTPFRTLEVDSFGKESGLWVVKTFSVFGPGWTTSIDFRDIRAGLIKDGVPGDLF